MKRKRLMTVNKRGLNYYSPLVAIMGVAILGLILTNLFVKQYNLASEFDLGREQFRIMLTESSAEKALLFVDNAVRLALEQAAYKYGKNGFYQPSQNEFYQSSSLCGNSNGFNYWTKEQSLKQNGCVPQMTPCYPEEDTMKSTFRSVFITALVNYVSGFNEKSGLDVEGDKVFIPFNYDFTISPVAGRTEIIGKSKELISITAAKTNKLVYEIKPSFRESITPDVIADGNDIATKAKQLLRKKNDELSSTLNSFNSQNPALQWKLASYSTLPTTCPHAVGTCPYCDVSGRDGCISSHEGKLVETISYNNVYAAFSVANGKSFYVSDPPASQPQLKAVTYDFGLNWLEETGRSTICVP